MPRLVGKKTNAFLYLLLALIVSITGAVALEYFGIINLVPGFGKENKTIKTSSIQPMLIYK